MRSMDADICMGGEFVSFCIWNWIGKVSSKTLVFWLRKIYSIFFVVVEIPSIFPVHYMLGVSKDWLLLFIQIDQIE